MVPDTGAVTGGEFVVISGPGLCAGGDATNVTLCGVSAASIESATDTPVVVRAGVSGAPGLGDVAVWSESLGVTVSSNAFCYRLDAAIPREDLVLWLRADVGVLEESGAVSRWYDQSGSGFHALQASGSARPTVSTNTVSPTLPAVPFDGNDDYLWRADGLGIANSNVGFTLCIVFRYPASTVNNTGVFSLRSAYAADWSSADGMALTQKNDWYLGWYRGLEWLQGVAYGGSNPGTNSRGSRCPGPRCPARAPCSWRPPRAGPTRRSR